MRKKFKFIVAIAISLLSSAVLAGVLMSQWTEGTSRFCKYSDGEVIKISFGETCPSTN
ncbi:hypothetical protein [Cellvibrio sp. QJXJ]|uniref:hypothetical protein n=1 Tax=Cellvibrio sp. QJXJ TaxID=2964606 RepID=UPI0021C37B8A|nr:hypothetical protein [Cellvibrio sp. QJXJ]UUA74677.1 hypothetical protein NNX04_09590 [Cellvibrio sp. QJXJ]